MTDYLHCFCFHQIILVPCVKYLLLKGDGELKQNVGFSFILVKCPSQATKFLDLVRADVIPYVICRLHLTLN